MKKPHSLRVGLLEMPEQQSAEFLRTLSEWGSLPEVVSVPDAATLLAELCGQNPAAIRLVLAAAIETQQIPYWGLSERGHWEEGMLRVWVTTKHKPRYRPPTATTDGSFSALLLPEGPLHVEAMGINPADAVALLQRRGRKVPPELLALAGLTAAPTPDKRPGEVRWTDDEKERLRVYREKHGTKKAAEHFQISSAMVRRLLPQQAPIPTANNPFGTAPAKRKR